jgi:hypothetical protein
MTPDTPIQQTTAARPEQSIPRDLLYAARYYLLSRTGLLSVAGLAIVAGAALNWNWLVATGIAPILIALLPCAVMCGLGLCFHRLAGGSCAEEQPRPTVEANRKEESSSQLDLFEEATSASAHGHARAEPPEVISRESQSSNERRHSHA